MAAENHPLYMQPLAGNRPTETTLYLVKLSKILRREYEENIVLSDDYISSICNKNSSSDIQYDYKFYTIEVEETFNLIEHEDIIENV